MKCYWLVDRLDSINSVPDSMRIEDVSLFSTAVVLVPGTGVSLSISMAYICLKGNWEVENHFM